MYESTSSMDQFNLNKLQSSLKKSKVIRQSNLTQSEMYRPPEQTAKPNIYGSLLENHSPHQVQKRSTFRSDTFGLSPLQGSLKTEDRKISIDEEVEFNKKQRERSLSINIKSSARELIESKEYEDKLSNQWYPVFPEFNQEESVDMNDSEQGRKNMHEKMIRIENNSKEAVNHIPIFQNNVKRVQSKWLEDQTEKRSQSSQDFLKSPELFTSSQDVQKLSQIYNQFLIKNDSREIKKLNSTNQQLKGICKQIVSLLKLDPVTQKRKMKDDLIISKIYKIITSYESKKKFEPEKK